MKKTKPAPEFPTTPGKTAIRKELDAVVLAGRKPWTVLADWFDICEATLRMMPQHVLQIAATGKTAEDPPEIKALWQRLNEAYKPTDWRHFQTAFHLLRDEAELRLKEWDEVGGMAVGTTSWDILGDIYQEMNAASSHAGQFFTPWALACATVYPALCGTVENFTRPDEPYRILDPACGSGVLLLAAAACFPRDAVWRGWVQFWGNDIDLMCVKMARINMMLYGLNGWGRAWQDAGIVLESIATERSVGLVADVELPAGQLSLL